MASVKNIRLMLFEYIPEEGIVSYDAEKMRKDILELRYEGFQDDLNLLEDLGSNHGW